ncbi:MAG: hypothetical protein LQ346_006079 [Caloplaca aetnensis]|nr:MAG: hypothetical protein LQ346_006079 [Caloplaca aetnensis]
MESDSTTSHRGAHVTYWDPTFLTSKDAKNSGGKQTEHPVYCVIILNQPIENKKQIINICNGAWRTVYADGGANRIFHTARTNDEEQILAPDVICGDFDSLEKEAEDYFANKFDTAIVKDDNQYKTDLQKSLRQAKNLTTPDDDVTEVCAVVFGGIGGRFDHGLSQLHHLFQENVEADYAFPGRIYLVNSESICFLLDKGLNRIKTPLGPGLFRESVGIIPLGRPSLISTDGLEWNLTRQVTEFGGLMSTSNHIKRDWIEVNTSERVLLTIELDSL